MTIIEIKDLSHVIELALQRKILHDALDRMMTFSELWRACDITAGNLQFPLRTKADIARELFFHLDVLVEGGIVTTHGTPKKLESIMLTDFGYEHLKSVIFSHQERAPG